MKNSKVKSGASILPPLRSAERRTFDKKIDLDSTVRKEITERDSKLKKTVSLYNVDEMSFEELQTSVRRIMENPQQPFSFLANISDEFANNKHLSTKPTEINMQLASVAKRIESSKILLEKTKSRIEDLYLHAKQNDVCQSWKVYDVRDDKAKEEQLS
ncbi:PREDICTED: uncharacterized protein LOC108783536 isoform X2 [Cyphomyrmex costatus]|uniref:uncharacterized protein LOC108783536 isoform X2 n=1 Tax=Cyphomyrmex costatus TaxID=456900 RepID=UPI0008521DD0|nr:PREDICTED: uncharacterized protein LOC108783536 isoform X2 [Cyphomyrmex costatus]